MKFRRVGMPLFILCFSILYSADRKLSFIKAFPSLNSQKENDYIGEPFDAEVFNDRFFATDAQRGCIKEFSENGEIVRVIGRKGQGPGELQSPYVITINKADGIIYCYDSGNSKIVAFRINGEYLNSFKTSLGVWDMIFLDNYLYLSAYNALHKNLFMKMDMEGNIISFFGEFFDKRVNNLPIKYQEQLYGELRLTTDSEYVYAIYERIPYIQIYNKDGSLKKTVHINLKEAIGVYEKNISAPSKKRIGGRMGLSKWMNGGCIYNDCLYCYAPYQVGAMLVLNKEGNILHTISFQKALSSELLLKKRFIRKFGDLYLFIDFEESQLQIYSENQVPN